MADSCLLFQLESDAIAHCALFLVHKLKFKKDVLIAAITRGKETIVPRGNDTIEAEDLVVVVSKHIGLYDVADVLK